MSRRVNVTLTSGRSVPVAALGQSPIRGLAITESREWAFFGVVVTHRRSGFALRARFQGVGQAERFLSALKRIAPEVDWTADAETLKKVEGLRAVIEMACECVKGAVCLAPEPIDEPGVAA